MFLASLEDKGKQCCNIFFPTIKERAMVLQMVGEIMYGNESDVDNDLLDWALQNWTKLPTQSHNQLHT